MNNNNAFQNLFMTGESSTAVPKQWCYVLKKIGFDDAMLSRVEHVSVLGTQVGITGTNSKFDKRSFKGIYGLHADNFNTIIENLKLGHNFITEYNSDILMSSEENRGQFYFDFSKAHIVPRMSRETANGFTFIIAIGVTYDDSVNYDDPNTSLVTMIPGRPMAVTVNIALSPEAPVTPPAEEKKEEEQSSEGAQA